MKIVFMGSPGFAATSLAALIEAGHEIALVVSQPDKPAGRGKKLVSPEVAVLARARGIEVIQPRSARKPIEPDGPDGPGGPVLAEILASSGAAAGVVVAYGKILPREVLEAFPHGCFNVHASILPAYRGAAPIQRAIMAGERETGVSIMRLDEGMDTGPVVKTATIDIASDDTAGTLFEKLAPLGAATLVAALGDLEAGTLIETPQDHERATYAPMLEKSDGYIDWTRPAREVRDLIRGVDPWPTAQAMFGQLRLKLFGAYLAEGQGSPGEVLAAGERGVVVACGAGACGISEIQAPGRKRLPALSFARGRDLSVGSRLTSIK